MRDERFMGGGFVYSADRRGVDGTSLAFSTGSSKSVGSKRRYESCTRTTPQSDSSRARISKHAQGYLAASRLRRAQHTKNAEAQKKKVRCSPESRTRAIHVQSCCCGTCSVPTYYPSSHPFHRSLHSFLPLLIFVSPLPSSFSLLSPPYLPYPSALAPPPDQTTTPCPGEKVSQRS